MRKADVEQARSLPSDLATVAVAATTSFKTAMELR